MKNTIDEIAWISRIVLFDDERAFAKLLDKYHPVVRRILLAQTGGDEALSDDLTQEVFIKVWLNIRNFKMRSSFSTWLFRIAYNEYLDYVRCHRIVTDFSLLKDDIPIDIETVNDNKELVQACISQLSPQCRVCMVLFYIEGLKTHEISDIVGIAETAVRAHLSRGRKRMKELIENDRL